MVQVLLSVARCRLRRKGPANPVGAHLLDLPCFSKTSPSSTPHPAPHLMSRRSYLRANDRVVDVQASLGIIQVAND
jgi:hypothetical protein